MDIKDVYEQHEEKGTTEQLMNDLLKSCEEKSTISPDVAGLLYGWREDMLKDVERINKFIPIKKSFHEQLEIDIHELIQYLEKIGMGTYADPHVDFVIIKRLKQYRLRLRENLGSKPDEDIKRITNLVGEVDPDDINDNECENDIDGYGE
jgi:hypothetical protein